MADSSGFWSDFSDSDVFKTLFENNPYGALLIRDGVFVACNRSAARLLKFEDPAMIAGRKPLELSPLVQPEGVLSSEKAERMITQALKNGSAHFDWIHRCADGSALWVEVTLTHLPLNGKDYLYVLWHDASERRRLQEIIDRRLQAVSAANDGQCDNISFYDLFDVEYIQKIQDAFSEATGVASLITLPDGTPVTRPSKFCRLCMDIIRKTEKGYKNCCHSDGVIGRYNPDGPIIQPCLSGGLWDAGSSIMVGGRHVASWLIGQVRNEALDEEKMLAYADEIGADPVEFASALKEVPVMSRERFEKVCNALYLFASELSQKAYLNLQQARTIRQHQRAVSARQESEERFKTLFENLTEGVALHEVIYDGNGMAVDYKIIAVNPAYTRHTGLKLPESGEVLATQLYKTAEPPYLKEFSRVASSGQPEFFELYFAPLSRHFSVSVVSPRAGQFATVFEDITERLRKNRELQDKTEEMARFTYAVSHDLKSPLVTIMTFLGYLKQDIARSDQENIDKDLGYINKAADKMSKLLDELLQLSRIGRKTNPAVEMDIREVVREALDMVAGRISERAVKIVEELPAISFTGDRPRITEVFQNLIDNAVKYMSDRSDPVVEIGCEQAGENLIFYVRDNGIGIDSRHLPKLFGLFEKLNPGTEGTGIGLALVRRIIEVHGGSINAESEGTGKGTVFRFTLPGAKIKENGRT